MIQCAATPASMLKAVLLSELTGLLPEVGQAEVEDHDPSRAVDQDVGRLEVEMQHPGVMQRLDAGDQLGQ